MIYLVQASVESEQLKHQGTTNQNILVQQLRDDGTCGAGGLPHHL